ncbi:MAG: ADP compounds hydrolase NudE [Proteobacteria bacterium]|nr:ADP compounds hydrolase NudE [Pseudomonadota bacterium]
MPLPTIRKTQVLARSRFFTIEAMHLTFSNGVERVYERLPAVGEQGVIVVAVNDKEELLLIREYAAGFHEFQLTLPKGAAEVNETLQAAAARELAEEAGFGARDVRFVKRLSIAPGHMGFTINVLMASDLYPHEIPGDEPEPPELVLWPLAKIEELLTHEEFYEARAIAALTLCLPQLRQRMGGSS